MGAGGGLPGHQLERHCSYPASNLELKSQEFIGRRTRTCVHGMQWMDVASEQASRFMILKGVLMISLNLGADGTCIFKQRGRSVESQLASGRGFNLTWINARIMKASGVVF